MSEIREELEKIKNPQNIYGALYASGPYTLMKFFKRDSTVNQIIEAGTEVVPLIAEELEKKGWKLNKITLSCYAYILQKVDLKSAVRILKPFFHRAVDNPDPFFVYFIAHALRQSLKLRVNPKDPLYSRGELLETLEMIKKVRESE